MRLKINFSDGNKEYKGGFGETQPTIQPDWSQNSPKDPRYIQNRTHYDSRVYHPGTTTWEKTFDTPRAEDGVEKIADAPFDLVTLKAIDVVTTYYAGDGDGNQTTETFEFHGTIYEIYDFSSEMELPPESAYDIVFSNEISKRYGLIYCATDEAAAALGIEPGLFVGMMVRAISCSITLHTETVTGELKTIDHKYIDDMYYKTTEPVEAENSAYNLTGGYPVSLLDDLARNILQGEGITSTDAKLYFLINGKKYRATEARYMSASEAGETGYQFKYVIGDCEFRTISFNAGTYEILPEGTDLRLIAEGTTVVYHPVPREYLPAWEELPQWNYDSGLSTISLDFESYYKEYRKLVGRVDLYVGSSGSSSSVTAKLLDQVECTLDKLSKFGKVVFEAERIGSENNWLIKAWRYPAAGISVDAGLPVHFAVDNKFTAYTGSSSISWLHTQMSLWGMKG